MGSVPHAQVEREAVRASSQDRPDVSIIIAAYDVAPFIEAAVASALAQTGVTCEVIVVDDHSRDETASIVREMGAADARIRIIQRPKRCGPGAARNEAVKAARGRWIQVLDGDDVILPDRTTKLLALATTSGADVVADNFARMTNEGIATSATMFPDRGCGHSILVDAATFILGNLALERGHMPLGAIKPIVRADFIKTHAITYPGNIAIGEDYHFLLDCLLQGARMIVTSQSFYHYRMRPRSQSWRLERHHIEALSAAHSANTELSRQAGSNAELARAAHLYRRALQRALRLAILIDDLKMSRISPASIGMVMRPGLWPLVTRFGLEALGKRMRRLRATPLRRAPAP